MEFSVSDHVVHPKHGTGQITGVERLDLIEGFERYYVIEMTDQRMTVRVPIRMSGELGVRPVMSRTKLDQVLDILRAVPNPLPENYKSRQAWVRQQLKTGQAIPIAEAVRDLVWHRDLDHLTKADGELLTRGQTMLAEEIALVLGCDAAEADQLVTSILAASMETRTDVPAKTPVD